MFKNFMCLFILLFYEIVCMNGYNHAVQKCKMEDVKNNFNSLKHINFVFYQMQYAKWRKDKNTKRLFEIMFRCSDLCFLYYIDCGILYDHCDEMIKNIKSINYFTFEDYHENVFQGTLDKDAFFDYDEEIWPSLCLINWRLLNDISNDKLKWSENDGYPMITWNPKPNVNSSIQKIVQIGDYYEGELWINYAIYFQCYWRVS